MFFKITTIHLYLYLFLPVSDCKVSAWGPWSPCDAACGPGTMTRERTVERAPQHGGRHCPSLLQKRGCQGTDCAQHDRSAIRGE